MGGIAGLCLRHATRTEICLQLCGFLLRKTTEKGRAKIENCLTLNNLKFTILASI